MKEERCLRDDCSFQGRQRTTRRLVASVPLAFPARSEGRAREWPRGSQLSVTSCAASVRGWLSSQPDGTEKAAATGVRRVLNYSASEFRLPLRSFGHQRPNPRLIPSINIPKATMAPERVLLRADQFDVMSSRICSFPWRQHRIDSTWRYIQANTAHSHD